MEREIKNPMPELLWDYRHEYPYMFRYACTYAPFTPISKWDVPPEYKDREAVYKAALEKGVTWQEMIGYRSEDAIR